MGFIRIFFAYRALTRATREECTSGSLANSLHQGVLIVSDRGEHEGDVWPVHARLLQCLLGGLTTRYVGIVMSTHADTSFGSHGRASSCLLRTHPSLGGVVQHLAALLSALTIGQSGV